MESVTVMMIGDVVGDAGLAALKASLPALRAEYGAALTVVNGENAASGYGLTAELAKSIFAAGADIITSGNHIWEKREFWAYLDAEPCMVRPANYPAPAAGKGCAHLEKNGARFAVINLQGREYMPPIDCPFRCFDTLYKTLCSNPASPSTAGHTGGLPIIVVDFHAESTEEKEALGFYLDGRAAIVAGTHTHVQTADEKILPLGSAYITDLGMTGSIDSVIGMKTENCITRVITQTPVRMECAGGNAAVQGIAVRVCLQTGRALSISRFSV